MLRTLQSRGGVLPDRNLSLKADPSETLSFPHPKILLLSILALGIVPRLSAETAAPGGAGDGTPDGISDAAASPQSQEEAVPAADEGSDTNTAEAAAGDNATTDNANQEHWLDRYRTVFKTTVDDSANYVDRALALEEREDEPENTRGRVSANIYWQKRKGFTFRGRFRVQMALDSINHQLNAMAGRGDPEDFMDGRYDSNPRFASFYRGAESDEFLAGLSYRPDWVNSGSFSLGGGLSFSDGVNSYVNINYRYRHLSDDDRWLIGAYQTFYYETGNNGFGSRTVFEPEFLISENWLLRNYTVLELNQSILGIEFQSTFTLYQDLGRNRAIAYEAGVYGETNRRIRYTNYGATVTYRQQMFREWLYGEVTVGVAYPRQLPEWERRGDPMIGFGVEFFFGD